MKHLLSIGALVALVAGCASSPAAPELASARSAYNAAAHGPAARLDPADLHTAHQTLQVAEQYFEDDGDSQDARDVAYIAQRRAELASARADAVQALRNRDNTLAAMRANQVSQAELTSAALVNANKELAANRRALSAEQERANQATAALTRLANVKRDDRGLVITLNGSVIFASGKAQILPSAKSKLDEVANALARQDQKSMITVQGFTDSTGSAALNEGLSQQRAEAVRAYLTSHGVAQDRVTAEGLGASNPIADNASPEGRANNRRVEIVVKTPDRP